MTTKFKLSTALMAAGLMAMTMPAFSQQATSPKAGPDVNQPKYVPDASSTSGAGAGAGTRDNTVQGGGGNSNAGGTSNSPGAAGTSSGSGTSGGTGGSAGTGGGNSN